MEHNKKQMKHIIAIALLTISTTAGLAQQAAPDPAFLQKAITALQTQRNAALDAQAGAEARAATLAEELEKLKAQIAAAAVAAKEKPAEGK
jgi:hypothetical protein